MILFSIIVPVYNVKDYIEATLRSICRNQLEQMEVIVVDDGSKDETKEITARCLKKWNPPHYQIISQPNQGVSVARNSGIGCATGKYLIFCDGDDICDGNMMKILTPIAERDSDMLVWRYWTENGGEKSISQEDFGQESLRRAELFERFVRDQYRIRLGNFAVKKSILDKYRICFTPGCKYGEDLEFAYKCLAVSQNVQTIDEALYTYIRRPGTAVSSYNIRRFDAPMAIQRVYDFVKENTTLTEDKALDNYLNCGLFILHSIFSFDACIKQRKKGKMQKLWKEYRHGYPELEGMLKKKVKNMVLRPNRVSGKRLKFFCFNRYMYLWFYSLKR